LEAIFRKGSQADLEDIRVSADIQQKLISEHEHKNLNSLAPIKERAIVVNLFNYSDADWDQEKYLYPIDVATIPADDKRNIITRARTETMIGGITRFSTELRAHILTCRMIDLENNTNVTDDDPFLGMMKSYLSVIGYDPFIEDDGDRVFNLTKDTCAATRCLLLLNASMLWRNGIAHPEGKNRRGDREPTMLIEVVRHLFKNPMNNWSSLKGPLTIMHQCVFFRSPEGKGEVLNWQHTSDAVADRYSIKPVAHNQEGIHEYRKKDFLSAKAELRDMGLPRLAAELEYLNTAIVNHDNMARWRDVINLPSLIGYVRGHPGQTVRDMQAIQTDTVEYPAFEHELYSEWYDLVKRGIDENRLMTYDEWLATLPNTLTTKSAGVKPINFVLRMKFPDSDEYRDIRITIRDKASMYQTDPDKWIAFKIDKLLTSLYPGVFGMRSTTERKMRPVMVIPLPINMLEQPFGSLVYGVQKHMEVFTISVASGRVVTDHWDAVVASGSQIVAFLAMDASQFDASQMHPIATITIRAMFDAAKAAGVFESGWGPWPSYFHAIAYIYGAVYKDAVFIIDGQKYSFDQVLSGEYVTLGRNNMTSRANWRYVKKMFYSRLSHVIAKLTILTEQIMGDDFIVPMRLVAEYDPSIGKKTIVPKKMAEDITEVAVESSADNGISMDPKKTTFSLRYEYLKVYAYYGYFFQRLLPIMIFSSETGNASSDIIENFSGWYSKVATYVSRGGRLQYFLRLRFVMTVLGLTFKRKVSAEIVRGKGRVRYAQEKKADQAYRLTQQIVESSDFKGFKTKSIHKAIPFYLMYVPKVMNGFGHLPHTTWSSNVDAVIVLTANDHWKRMISAMFTWTKKLRGSEIKKFLGRAVADHVMKAGSEHAAKHVLPTQMRVSRAAKAILESKGIEVQIYYPDLARETVLMAAENISDVKAAERIAKARKLESALEIVITLPTIGEAENDIYGQFAWLRNVSFSYGDNIKEVQPVCPMPGLDPALQKLFRCIGVGTTNDNKLDPQKAMAVFRTKTTPPSLQPETMRDQLGRPGIVGNKALMANVAMAWGTPEREAIAGAAKFESKSHQFLLVSEAKQFSIGDEVGNFLDLSLTRHYEVVTTPTLVKGTLQSVLAQLGMLLAITAPDLQPRHVRMYIRGDPQETVDALTRTKPRPISKFLRAVPVNWVS
jgi:hypothetical protein